MFTYLPLRKRLILNFVSIVIISGIFSTIAGIKLIGDNILKQAHEKVRMDINSAWMVYNTKLHFLEHILKLNASRDIVRNNIMQGGDINKLQVELTKIKREYDLDFLSLTDKDGIVILRTCPPYKIGDNQSNDELVAKALSKKIVKSTEIMSSFELEKECYELPRKAYMDIVPTEKAKMTIRKVETSGMVLKSAVPVVDINNNVIGVLYGGILLNRNYEVVDKIRELVHKEEKYKNKDVGTATIFQWDLRISTNVKKKNGQRAIGTRVSSEVYDSVLENGIPWIGRAFVVNENYISVCEPIRNIKNEIIGMLYVGILEEKYTDARNKVILTFFSIMTFGVLIAILISFLISQGITYPIGKLVRATEEVSSGNLSSDVIVKSNDEIKMLAESFNKMRESLRLSLKEKEEVISRLEKLNKYYMEMLGFINHELMHPLSVLKGYLVMLEDGSLGETNEKQKKAISVLRRNVETLINMLVKYLQLSRIERGKLEVNKIKLNFYTEILMPIAENEFQALSEKEMKLKLENEEMFKTVLIEGDPILLKVVFTNLINNAIKYGNAGSEIKIGVEITKQEYQFYVYNEGIGIPKDKKEVIFNQFERLDREIERVNKGTGLGLFIARFIINKHGGNMWVESEEGKYANFIFTLPK